MKAPNSDSDFVMYVHSYLRSQVKFRFIPERYFLFSLNCFVSKPHLLNWTDVENILCQYFELHIYMCSGLMKSPPPPPKKNY